MMIDESSLIDSIEWFLKIHGEIQIRFKNIQIQ